MVRPYTQLSLVLRTARVLTNSPPPSPTQSFEPSDDETQHPRDGDNVSDNVRAHSAGKGVSDDEHEHEQVSRAVNSCTRRACRDSLAAHH